MQRLQVLYTIPEGSIPINGSDYTKTQNIYVNSFASQIFNYWFYFPKSGKYKAIPPNISRNGVVLAVAQECEFDVLEKEILKKRDTIDQILISGSKRDILDFVAKKNIQNANIFQFKNIYHLLNDKDFYLKFVDILRKKRIFDQTTWSFSLYHADRTSLKEFLNSVEITEKFQKQLKYFNNEFINIQNFKLLEYFPLINQRIHQLSQNKNNILNKEFKIQYKSLLEYLVEVPKMKTQEILILAYHLILQDRIEETIRIFSKIDQKELQTCPEICRLQFDYFSAYLDFYSGYPNFKIAREICEKYLDYPILSWRNLFYDITNQLAEYDGEELINDDLVKLNEKKKNLTGAKTEETIRAEINQDEIIVFQQNCYEIIINYYLIDLEVLYSKNPFLLQV